MSSLWDPLFLGWVNDFSSPSSIWPVSPTKAGPLPEARTAEEQQWPSEPSSPNLASFCMNFWGVAHFIIFHRPQLGMVLWCFVKDNNTYDIIIYYPSWLSQNWVITIWWIQCDHPIILSSFSMDFPLVFSAMGHGPWPGRGSREVRRLPPGCIPPWQMGVSKNRLNP